MAKDPLRHPEVTSTTGTTVALGYGAALALMVAALLITQFKPISTIAVLSLTGLLAVLAITAQLLFLMRLDVSPPQIWKSVALVLTLPLLVVMLGLTGWMFHTLFVRVMLHSVMRG